MGGSILVVILVDEHLRKSVDLWNQLPDIRGTGNGIEPRAAVVVEDAICAVELAALEGECADAVRSYPDEVVEDNSRGGVVGTEVVLVE